MFPELINSMEMLGGKYAVLYVSDPFRSIQLPYHEELERFLAEGAGGNASLNSTHCDEVCQIKSSLLEGVLATLAKCQHRSLVEVRPSLFPSLISAITLAVALLCVAAVSARPERPQLEHARPGNAKPSNPRHGSPRLDLVVLHLRISPDSARLGSPRSKHAWANSALLGLELIVLDPTMLDSMVLEEIVSGPSVLDLVLLCPVVLNVVVRYPFPAQLPDCSQRNNARSGNSRPGSARRSLSCNSRRGHDLLMDILEVVGGEM
ncbi:hypothetical protein POTOM_011244 [Populus tomentosa]|uniref:Uncharacterized protein n=1 Tax=Populus tomentosa TaxID=118781 RepID=A0A8X8A515_POPTO|nr:hypothetical protein POTOM_011244 [Populus tomentosa]